MKGAKTTKGESLPVKAEPAPTALPVAQGDLPASLREYLRQMDLVDATQPGSEAEVWNQVQRGLEMELAGRIIAGHRLNVLRATLPPRSFAEGLKERGIARSTAYQALDIFGRFAELPDLDSVRACAQIGLNRMLALRHWTNDDLAQLAHGKTVNGVDLDSITDMSVRDVQEHERERLLQNDEMARLRRDAESAKQREAAARNELQRERNDALKRAREAGLPPFALAARDDATALTEQMEVCLDGLDRIVAAVTTSQEAGRDPHNASIAASSVYHLLLGVFARTQQVLHSIQEIEGDALTAVPRDEHLLNDGEVTRALKNREAVLGRAAVEQNNREAERANNQAGRRGRKRKVQE